MYCNIYPFKEDGKNNGKDTGFSSTDENDLILPNYDEEDEVFVETNKEDWKDIIVRTDAVAKFKKRSKSSRSSSSRSKDHGKNEKRRKTSSNRLPSDVLDSSAERAKMVIENLTNQEETSNNSLQKSSSKSDRVFLRHS